MQQTAECQSVHILLGKILPFADQTADQCDVDTVRIGGIIDLSHIVQHIEHGDRSTVFPKERQSFIQKLIYIEILVICDKIIDIFLHKGNFLGIICFKSLKFRASSDTLGISFQPSCSHGA